MGLTTWKGEKIRKSDVTMAKNYLTEDEISELNSTMLVVYISFVTNCSPLLTGHDEYGLGQLRLGALFILAHIVIGFVHGLYLQFKRNRLKDTTTI